MAGRRKQVERESWIFFSLFFPSTMQLNVYSFPRSRGLMSCAWREFQWKFAPSETYTLSRTWNSSGNWQTLTSERVCCSTSCDTWKCGSMWVEQFSVFKGMSKSKLNIGMLVEKSRFQLCSRMGLGWCFFQSDSPEALCMFFSSFQQLCFQRWACSKDFVCNSTLYGTFLLLLSHYVKVAVWGGDGIDEYVAQRVKRMEHLHAW